MKSLHRGRDQSRKVGHQCMPHATKRWTLALNQHNLYFWRINKKSRHGPHIFQDMQQQQIKVIAGWLPKRPLQHNDLSIKKSRPLQDVGLCALCIAANECLTARKKSRLLQDDGLACLGQVWDDGLAYLDVLRYAAYACGHGWPWHTSWWALACSLSRPCNKNRGIPRPDDGMMT